ncbi:MAG: PDZ domain-containing protein [Bacteroidota bacterium]
MKSLLTKATTLLMMAVFGLSLSAQNGKSVTIKLTKKTDRGRVVYDTTFVMNESQDLEDILDQLGYNDVSPNQSVEKTIIINDNDELDGTNRIVRSTRTGKPMMGIYIDDNNGPGVKLSGVTNDGAAQKAGLKGGDIITNIGGISVNTESQLVTAKKKFNPGQSVKVEYYRGNNAYSTNMVMGGTVEREGNSRNNVTARIQNAAPRSNGKPLLGVYLSDVNGPGVKVTGVTSGGAAQKAGLRKGDIITSLNGIPVNTERQLLDERNKYAPGQGVEIEYFRDNRVITTNMIMGGTVSRPSVASTSSNGKPMMGVYLGSSSNRGVKVTNVTRGGAAATAGIKSGDFISKVGRYDVRSESDLVSAKNRYAPGDEIEVEFVRDGRVYETDLVLQGTGRSSAKKNDSWDWDWDWNWDWNGKKDAAAPVSGSKAYLGIYSETVTQSRASELNLQRPEGVYITGVVNNTAAQEAGLRKGDVIVDIGGQEIKNSRDLTSSLSRFKPDDKVEIVYLRNGRVLSSFTKLGGKGGNSSSRSTTTNGSSNDRAYLGVYLESASRDQGARVTGLVSGGAAERAGLRKGDIIYEFDGEEVEDYDDLVDEIKEHSPGEEIKVRFQRDGDNRRAYVTLRGKNGKLPNARFDNSIFNDGASGFSQNTDRRELLELLEDPTLEMDYFDFYPNPSEGRFRLKFRTDESGPSDIKVYSPDGRVVYREKIQNFRGNYDREVRLPDDLPRGVYLLSIEVDGRGLVDRITIR